jgi:acyl-CoA thioesterase
MFDNDTRVEPAGPHAYTALLSERWNGLHRSPYGGYVLAVALRALARDMPLPDPVVVSATFLRPSATGPADIATEVVRAGRRVATGEARLTQDGKEIVRTVATFADLAQASDRIHMRSQPPELPAPERCRDLMDGSASLPGVHVTDRFEYRYPVLPHWAGGPRTGEPDVAFWLRFRDGSAADLLALTAMVDAAAPAVLELGERGSATIELTVHIRARPAPGWLACRTSTRHVIGGYHEEDFEIWDSTGALVAQSRQFALLL